MNSTQVTDSTQVKVVVKKAIPKKTMGYLKFAYWALHQECDNIHTLFLDRSIDEIIDSVSNIVDNGDQHIAINNLRKNLLNPPKPPKAKPEPKAKPAPKAKSEPKAKAEPKEPKAPKAKPASKAKPALDLPDTIVTQLVTLARQDFETPPETFVETIPQPIKKSRAKKSITPVTTEPIPETIAETIPETIAETIAETIPETIPETIAETIAETIPETIKKTKTKKTTEIPTETIANKKNKVKKNTIIEPIIPILPTDQLSEELFA